MSTRHQCKNCSHMWPVQKGDQLPTCRLNSPTLAAQPIPTPVNKGVLSQGPPEMQISWLQLGAWPPVRPEAGCSKWEEDIKLDS